MNRSLYVALCIAFVACSPYKKVTLSASDRLSTRWKGASEGEVVHAVGSYKFKNAVPDGYLVRWDYSYPVAAPNATQKLGDVTLSPTQTPRFGHPDPGNSNGGGDSVIRRMDFYFDKAGHVQYVEATGYPDSVYYIKR